MAKFININDIYLIDIEQIQSVEFIGVAGSKGIETWMAVRFAQIKGVPLREVTNFDNNYEVIVIELKSGHLIEVVDFELDALKDYLLKQIGKVSRFDSGEVRYYKPGRDELGSQWPIRVHLTKDELEFDPELGVEVFTGGGPKGF